MGDTEGGDKRSKQEGCFACVTQVWLAFNHNTSDTLGNEFHVRSVLQGQVCLAAVNQICVIHEAMNGCNNLKIHYWIASKM